MHFFKDGYTVSTQIPPAFKKEILTIILDLARFICVLGLSSTQCPEQNASYLLQQNTTRSVNNFAISRRRIYPWILAEVQYPCTYRVQEYLYFEQ